MLDAPKREDEAKVVPAGIAAVNAAAVRKQHRATVSTSAATERSGEDKRKRDEIKKVMEGLSPDVFDFEIGEENSRAGMKRRRQRKRQRVDAETGTTVATATERRRSEDDDAKHREEAAALMAGVDLADFYY